MSRSPPEPAPWWKTGVIYQVYPRSFMDADGDGIGDLAGILGRLDHLAGAPDALDVDALWLSPVYPSPQADFGYDISDYCDIDPVFGDLQAFRRLLEAAHARGLKVLMDLVFNHTSDRHPWFQEARISRESPHRDWYIWRDGEPGRPPNNWVSPFGTSAWTWDPGTRQFYLHTFLPQQPDLNWRNPAVQEAILDVMRFWLDLGVDGFRLDVFNAWFKDASLRSNPRRVNPAGWLYRYVGQRHIHDRDQPEMLPMLARMRALLDDYGARGQGERMFVGETLDEGSFDEAARYYGRRNDGLSLVFNFELLRSPWRAAAVRRAIERWNGAVPAWAWPSWVLSNHDVRRHASRHGDGPERRRVRMAAVLLMTLRGTPFLYQGEELGLLESRVPFSRIQDPPGRRFWPFYKGRDGCRTPLPWSAGPSAGFTTGLPWLPVDPAHAALHAEGQRADPGSVLNLYRRCIALRKAHPALQTGDFAFHDAGDDDSVAWLRSLGSERLVVLLNFARSARSLRLPGDAPHEVRLSTAPGIEGRFVGRVELPGEAALVLETLAG